MDTQKIYNRKEPADIKPIHYNQGMASFGAHKNQQYYRYKSQTDKNSSSRTNNQTFTKWRDLFEKDY